MHILRQLSLNGWSAYVPAQTLTQIIWNTVDFFQAFKLPFLIITVWTTQIISNHQVSNINEECMLVNLIRNQIKSTPCNWWHLHSQSILACHPGAFWGIYRREPPQQPPLSWIQWSEEAFSCISPQSALSCCWSSAADGSVCTTQPQTQSTTRLLYYSSCCPLKHPTMTMEQRQVSNN